MNDATHDGGFLSGAPPEAAVMDPLDAVAVVAGSREAAGVGEREAETDRGIVVETKIRMEEPDGTGAAGPVVAENEGYGAFEWPDGFAADPKAMAKFAPLAKRLGLPKSSAQALAGLYADLERDREAAQSDFIARNNSEWLREIRRHPEFGGGNLERTSESVAALLRRHGSPLLLAQVRQMNVQNWPEMFYFLARVAGSAAEDCSPASRGGAVDSKPTAQLLFPGLK